jgi:hypothetical protein
MRLGSVRSFPSPNPGCGGHWSRRTGLNGVPRPPPRRWRSRAAPGPEGHEIVELELLHVGARVERTIRVQRLAEIQ